MSNFGKGYIADPEHVRLAKPSLRTALGAPFRLPSSSTALVDKTPPIRDQSFSSGCTGFAKVRCIDTRLAFLGMVFEQHSPLGVWALARIEERMEPDEPLRNVGVMPSDVMRAIRTWGVPTETSWPFDLEKINDPPPLDVLEEAARFHVSEDYSLDSDDIITDIKHAISSGYPVFFGAQVDQVFEDYNGTGLIPPAVEGEELGGHALTILGYEGDEFICANSWGTSWGWHGFFRVGPDFFLDPRAGDFAACEISPKNAKQE